MKYWLLSLSLISYSFANGQSYFQQQVNTRIDVRLDDEQHYLHGYEEFIYTNNSPDTLRYIYLHLWPNAYANDRTAFSEQQVTNNSNSFYYSAQKDKGHIDSLDASIDGQKISLFSTPNMPDIARADLPVPLPPGGSFTFSTPFRVKIPKVFSRMGHTKQAYYISQWFPKPAVYDRKGWHPIPYTDQGEFYSEIGSYDVSITLPRNYVVMATGNCNEASETEWLDSLSKLPLPTFTAPKKITKRWRDSVNRFPKSAADFKTLHFHEDRVHDFAWFADKRLIVRKDSFSVPGKDEPVTAYAAFLPSSKTNWIKATDYIKATVQRLSREVGPYPYKTVKAVEGDMRAGGGMEYPTVTVIDRSLNEANLMDVVVHEVGHNWFYGMLATNERDVAWMDEGINTFYEHKITRELREDTSFENKKHVGIELDRLLYYQAAASGTDQPLNRTSGDYTKLNYGADVYSKAALLFKWLEGYMGKETFREGMQDYFREWQHRHPYPEDLQAVLQKHTDKSLDWFFKDALKDNRRIDFALKKVRSNKNNPATIIVKNRSAYAAPVRIDAYNKEHHLVDSLWSAPFTGKTTLTLSADSVREWRIGSEVTDLKTTNNFYKKNRLFHGRGLQLSVGAGWNRSDKERLFLLPAVGYNAYDGFMAGIVLHNITLPENNFRFVLAPVYGFQSQTMAGAGSLGYFIHPKHTFREIAVQADIKSFHYKKTDHNTPNTLYARYLKVAPGVSFIFKNPAATSSVTNTLLVKGYYIRENDFEFRQDMSDSLYKPSVVSQEKMYGLLRYTHQNNRLFNPFSYSGEAQLGADFAKITLEGNARIDYNQPGKSLYLRGFAGKFFTINNEAFAADRYWLNTTYTGVNDYLYDETYFGRNERDGLAYRQVSIKEGGFKIPTAFYATPLGRSDDWLVSLNVKTDLPLRRLPVRLFLDVATFSNAARLNPSGNKVLFEAGAEVHLLYDMLLIHVPFIYSKDYSDYLKSIYGNKQFGNSITFTLQLQNINWLRTVQSGLRQLY